MHKVPIRRVFRHGTTRTYLGAPAFPRPLNAPLLNSGLIPQAYLRPFSTTGARFEPHHARPKATNGEKKANPQKLWPRRFLIISLSAAAAYLVDEYAFASVARRSVRAVYVLSLVAYKYANGQKYSSAEELHEECAELIISMIRENKGLYVKLGQAIANQGALFPAAYQRRFTRLYDDAPVDSWREVDAKLRSIFGPDYETELFRSIDHTPIASALIAQVHKARLKEGNVDVAVKVQHPYIPRQIDADLAVYRIMSWVYAKMFDMPLDFSTGYISEQLLKEADFRNECANSRRLAEYIENDASARFLNVYVPNNYPHLSHSQVLITEWIEGVSLTDRQRLIDSKFDIAWLMKQYITIFAKQMFDYGFVHSDPHPGNMLVRFHQSKQQMVILDHGLYIELPQKFQHEYCLLWRNLLGFDLQYIDDLAQEWGIGSPELLKSMVQLRPPETVKAEDAPSSAELVRMLLADQTKFPPDLLFIQRTMRMMQNLNQSMGSPVNRINLLTEISLDCGPSRWQSWADVALYVKVRATLFCSNVVFWLFRARQIWLGDKYGDKGEGMEDYIDKYLKENARALGINLEEA